MIGPGGRLNRLGAAVAAADGAPVTELVTAAARGAICSALARGITAAAGAAAGAATLADCTERTDLAAAGATVRLPARADAMSFTADRVVLPRAARRGVWAAAGLEAAAADRPADLDGVAPPSASPFEGAAAATAQPPTSAAPIPVATAPANNHARTLTSVIGRV